MHGGNDDGNASVELEVKGRVNPKQNLQERSPTLSSVDRFPTSKQNNPRRISPVIPQRSSVSATNGDESDFSLSRPPKRISIVVEVSERCDNRSETLLSSAKRKSSEVSFAQNARANIY